MPFVSCSDLSNQMTIAVNAMTPTQRTALCSALNCAPTTAAIITALMAVPGAGVAGNVFAINGGVPTFVPAATPLSFTTGANIPGSVLTMVAGVPTFVPASTPLSFVAGANIPGSILTMVGGVPTFVAAPPIKETALGMTTSLRPLAVAASGSGTRTFTNVSHDTATDTSFGTWDVTKTTFTFTKAGSYQFSASAALIAQVTANGAVSTQGSVTCDMVIGGMTFIVGGVNFDTGPTAPQFPVGTGGVTISLPGITVGTTVHLDCGTNAPVTGAGYNIWYGIGGTAVGGGNSACGLFISTW
jgi:hypothetical protein